MATGAQDLEITPRPAVAPPTSLDLENTTRSVVSPPAAQVPEPETRKNLTDSATRQLISFLLLALLTTIIVVAFAELIYINAFVPPGNSMTEAADDADRLMSLVNVIFGPVVTLFSSIVGFYFGARTAKEGTGG